MLKSLFQTITDLTAETDSIRRRAYGVIEVRDQEFCGIHLRPYPKLISVAEIHWATLWKNRSPVKTDSDRVLLYYNQPMWHRNFLSLKYFVSDYKTSLFSIAVCLSVLDYVACLKNTDAIVTEITNERIKDRHLEHFGWEKHLLSSSKRHWIKRFYGEYPSKFLFQPPKIADWNSGESTNSMDKETGPAPGIIPMNQPVSYGHTNVR